MELEWDIPSQRRIEQGLDHGVLYLRDENGEYTEAEVWNGLTTVTESPSGAESTKTYADNIPYITLKSAEEYGATIEALYYPDSFGRCDGSAEPLPGVWINQQARESFGFVYRTRTVTATNPRAGYKLNLVWNADAAPAEKPHTTVNDSPEAPSFSWELTTTPMAVGTFGGVEYDPVASMSIDSLTIDPLALEALEEVLFGTSSIDPRLPTPLEVLQIIANETDGPAEVTVNSVTNPPTYNSSTHVVTLPAVTGVQWKINGTNKAAGAQPALGVGQTATVTAHPTDGYVLSDNSDDDFVFTY